jgi:hypothetical protein
VFARQALYHLIYTTSPSCLVVFHIGTPPTPGWPVPLPIYLHHLIYLLLELEWCMLTCPLYLLRLGLANFLLSCPQTMALLIFPSRVTGIIGISHHTWHPWFLRPSFPRRENLSSDHVCEDIEPCHPSTGNGYRKRRSGLGTRADVGQ